METKEVQCPSCCQVFDVALPPLEEQPCEVDYDCEICCRPMLIRFEMDSAEAMSLADL